MQHVHKPVKMLDSQTIRKIAAGEVIDRPAAVIRELLDNAIDAGASKIQTEISDGGIGCIRVTDNGCGMTKDDLALCTDMHTTSKITTADELFSLQTLGFRGEALSSIKAVSNVEITTTTQGPAAWKLYLNSIVPARLPAGTIVQVEDLFGNVPARKRFLKRPAAEANLCKTIFLDKALPHYSVEMRFSIDGTLRFMLPPRQSLRQRCLDAFAFKESDSLFFEIEGSGECFSFRVVLGSPDVIRSDKRALFVFVNNRRINEFGLVQAMDYGSEGYFPNGGHPVAFLFLQVEPSRVDFNIHPAKKEARFQDYGSIHHAVSSCIAAFYRQHTVAHLLQANPEPAVTQPLPFSTQPTVAHTTWSEKNRLYSELLARKPLYESASAAFSQGPMRFTDSRISFTPSAHVLPPHATSAMQDPVDIPPADFKLLGQVAGTFIAVERNDTLYLIDQHAAHERIIFDELMQHAGGSQELLIPYRIMTDSDHDDVRIRKNQGLLAEVGFGLADEGGGVWVVHTVPIRWKGTEQDLARDIIQSCKQGGDILYPLLASTACRAACKAGDLLDPLALRRIVAQAFMLPEPLCPHGRPIWIVLTREELFKRVRRT
ncbi:MAG: DNA mismatch repair endonuclease MutL [Treponema sp.]